MKKTICTLLLSILLFPAAFAGNPVPYSIFDKAGRPISFDDMIQSLAPADVVFFGEMHNCPITHWLEYKTMEALFQANKGQMNLGMEMFERDNQPLIDEFFQGVIGSDSFEDECRLWPNYSTDYEPLVSFARENGMRLIATNVPRHYAAIVKQHGLAYLDSLSDAAKQYFPPLPVPYRENPEAEKGFSLMAMLGNKQHANAAYIGQAQALKDATMAWVIAHNLDKKMVHVNGNYHSDANTGIITYLKEYAPKTVYKTIYTVKQEDVSKLEQDYLGHGDFYIVVPYDMVTSY